MNDDQKIATGLAQRDLKDLQIDPDSESGREFQFRVMAFGIMGVQPPIINRMERVNGSCGRSHEVINGAVDTD